ncbi:hypothetical protein GCM10027419_11170 [Pandoraea terrae]
MRRLVAAARRLAIARTGLLIAVSTTALFVVLVALARLISTSASVNADAGSIATPARAPVEDRSDTVPAAALGWEFSVLDSAPRSGAATDF